MHAGSMEEDCIEQRKMGSDRVGEVARHVRARDGDRR
jgi:hypothetical protein